MENLAGYIATGVVSLIVGIILRSLEARPKLVFWQPHYALFQIPGQNVITIQTDSITVQNLGRKSAEDVEIIFKSKPDHFMLIPPINYKEETMPTGGFLIRIDSLGAKEFFTLHLLSYATLPRVDLIRSKAGPAEPIPFQMQRKFPRWFQLLLAFILIVGLSFTLYWIIKAVIFISKNIGIG
jgi:hypothetical protein